MSTLEANKLFAVPGLVAVITGGGSGIGLMMTKALALNGAHRVYLLGRRAEVLEKAAQESPHGNIVPLVCDVTSKDSLKEAAERVKAEAGYINVLIANSGVGSPMVKKPSDCSSIKEFQDELWSLDSNEFNRTFEVNVSAVFFTVVAFLKLLDAGNQKKNVEQSSQIIATGSIAGFNRVPTGGYSYAASKTAVTHLTKMFSTMLAGYDIRANVLAPGLFPSDLSAPLLSGGPITADRIPARRLGDPEDLAGVILYLCSRAGAYSNGGVSILDGGRLSIMPGTF